MNGSVNFSVFIEIYIKINSRIWFGQVNLNFHFVDCNYIFVPMQSVLITTKAVSSKPAHGDVYSIQLNYVIKFVSDLLQVCGFLWFPPPIKLTHNVTETLLKVTINTWTLTVFSFEAGNRRISPPIAIKSLAMNFPSMG